MAKAKAVAKKKVVRKPAKKPAAKKKPKPTKKAAPRSKARPSRVSAPGDVALGEVTAPSGTLVIFDVGLVGYLPRAALEPMFVEVAVPRDRALRVTGTRVGSGRYADCWDHVSIELGAGEVAASRELGEAAVDFARLVCIDRAALEHWRHEDALDGRADVVFWGRDEVALAKALGAKRLGKEGYGWADLPVADAEARADRAAQLKAEHHWLLAMDYRPHSHHWAALAAARESPNGAGAIALGGAQALLFFTTWGDGVFPVFLDSDGKGAPVRVRIQLASGDAP
jgi:hypothetical protein